jgi:hypothetical protein
MVGSITVVQPDSSDQVQTITAAPLEMPALDVVAVKLRWPAELLSAPRPPQPATASQRCSVTVSTSRYHQHLRPPGV